MALKTRIKDGWYNLPFPVKKCIVLTALVVIVLPLLPAFVIYDYVVDHFVTEVQYNFRDWNRVVSKIYRAKSEEDLDDRRFD